MNEKNTNKIKKAACILIVRPDGKVLSASRRGRLDDIGLPGGKVDQGEEAWEAALREVYEETGIMLTKNDISFLYTRNCVSKIDVYETETFLCRTNDLEHLIKLETPFEKEKGIQITWSTWEELLDSKNSFAIYNRMLHDFYFMPEKLSTTTV